VSALAFSSNGGLLAVASSYTYEEGERDHPADAIYVRRVTDVEVKPSGA
jgi:cell cycle arrest protein BUB3